MECQIKRQRWKKEKERRKKENKHLPDNNQNIISGHYIINFYSKDLVLKSHLELYIES